MNLFVLLSIGIGLSMDAFAVSITQGLLMKKITWKKCLIIGLYFGVFQAGMPLIGYIVGLTFQQYIESVDHWIAFILLAVIGINMIREAFDKSEEEPEECDLGFKKMIVLAVATSIDALAVGISFAAIKQPIVPAITVIGITTFLISAAGVVIGHKFGSIYKNKAEILGGIILIAIGLKILIEHLFF